MIVTKVKLRVPTLVNVWKSHKPKESSLTFKKIQETLSCASEKEKLSLYKSPQTLEERSGNGRLSLTSQESKIVMKNVSRSFQELTPATCVNGSTKPLQVIVP